MKLTKKDKKRLKKIISTYPDNIIIDEDMGAIIFSRTWLSKSEIKTLIKLSKLLFSKKEYLQIKTFLKEVMRLIDG